MPYFCTFSEMTQNAKSISRCTTQATFGYIGGHPIYCASHKVGPVQDILNPMCTYMVHNENGRLVSGCELHASFALDGCRPIYCKTHSLDNMINVVKTACKHVGCNIGATYGFPLGTTPTGDHKVNSRIYCSVHRLGRMEKLKRVREMYDRKSQFHYIGTSPSTSTYNSPSSSPKISPRVPVCVSPVKSGYFRLLAPTNKQARLMIRRVVLSDRNLSSSSYKPQKQRKCQSAKIPAKIPVEVDRVINLMKKSHPHLFRY
jgi:hypothetical protein